MKRYWKIISICLVTLIVIGTFYIQSGFATNEHVTIEFEKIDGHEDEVKDLVLSGEYVYFSGEYMVNQLYQPLQITSEETIAPRISSLYQKLKSESVPLIFEELVDKHKNFMRGKDLTPNHFFEDEKVVAYASIKADNLYKQPLEGLAFNIEMMDKQSNEVTSIELDLPERISFYWIHVEHVQVIDGALKIMTQGYGMDDTDELRVYTIDIKERKLVSDDTIASSPPVENGWSDLRIINQREFFQGQKYFLIQIDAFEEEMRELEGEQNLIVPEYIVYDIENNQSKQIVAPDEAHWFIDDAVAIQDNTLFSPSASEDGLEVSVYDIENEEWKEKLTVALGDMNDDETPYMKIIDEKLVAVYETNDGHYLWIGNLHTGKMLYKGKLHVKNQGEDQANYQLYIHKAAFAQ